MRLYRIVEAKGLLLVFLLITLPAVGQRRRVTIPFSTGSISSIDACGADAYLFQSRLSADFSAREEKMNRDIAMAGRLQSDDTLVLPVVFHIINQNPSLISDQTILAALKDLNDAFSKSGNYALSTGADTKIRFCLAQTDPDGGLSTGITRSTTFYSGNLNPSIEDARLKNLVQWDPSKYINIWYVTSINDEAMTWFSCGSWTRIPMAGYATLPPNAGTLDGIVVTDFYKILAHEMGHYLGLYHTFEGGCTNNNCSLDGDKVCDTPPDASAGAVSSCTNPGSSCSTDTLSGFTVDMPDMVSNFMDYGNSACANAFTQGQADRMRNAIVTQRKGLLELQCQKPCSELITAAFTRDNADPVTGNTVTFTNTSSGAGIYQWLVNDQIISSSTDFVQTFNTPGKYKVTLKAFNNSTCFAAYSDFVIVTCGVTARFYTDKRSIASLSPIYTDSIYFANTSQNATSYHWLVSNDKGMSEQEVGSAIDLNYTFASPAVYSVRLIASNGSCSDTTEKYVVPVLDPTPDGVVGVQSVECYQKTKIRVSVLFCNSGYKEIPKGVPVSFYASDPRLGNAVRLDTVFFTPEAIPGHCCTRAYDLIIDVGRPNLSSIYVVFNDSGNSMPLHLPNTTILESDYYNNIGTAQNFGFKAFITPSTITAEPGDTLQLVARPSPGLVSSYTWSSAKNLSCTTCQVTNLIADSTTTKRVIEESHYGCLDTAYVEIKVPPANDYTVHINEVFCSAKDSLYVSFNLNNSFKRGVIPKGLKVSFYSGNPALTGAGLLPPVFLVPDTVKARQAVFHTVIKGMPPGDLFAAVNNKGTVIPVQFPADSTLQEKDYNNNDTVFSYKAQTVSISPADTTVFRKQSFAYTINTPIYDPATTKWTTGPGYTLSCTTCSSPVITAYNNVKVPLQTANKYGCIIKGEASVNIYPPDMTVKILDTKCFTNSTTLVTFQVCMNNGYDSVYKNLPVSFYDSSTNRLLPLVFYTRELAAGNCNIYSTVVSTPQSFRLRAVVNDNGNSASTGSNHAYTETNYLNDISDTAITPFRVSIIPADTTILIRQTISLQTAIAGGQANSYTWSPSTFLSCFNCSDPVVTPNYSMRYLLTVRNENACTDTAYATVQIKTNNLINIPDAFTPNGDGLNDIFYILGSTEISVVKNFSIFNRWGQKVFEASNFLPNDPTYGWNGTLNSAKAETGAYVYSVTIQLKDGTEKLYKGTVLLIR